MQFIKRFLAAITYRFFRMLGFAEGGIVKGASKPSPYIIELYDLRCLSFTNEPVIELPSIKGLFSQYGRIEVLPSPEEVQAARIKRKLANVARKAEARARRAEREAEKAARHRAFKEKFGALQAEVSGAFKEAFWQQSAPLPGVPTFRHWLPGKEL